MFADFAARGRSSLNCRELNWTAPVKLAAVQTSPWLHQGSYRPITNKEHKTEEQNKRGREEVTPKGREGHGRHQTHKPNKFNGQGQWTIEDSLAARALETSTRMQQQLRVPHRHITHTAKKKRAEAQDKKNRRGRRGRTKTPTQGRPNTKEGGEGGGGSTRQGEKGRTRTRGGAQVP